MSEPYHILFIDDDALILAIAEKALSGERHCTACAQSAVEALNMLKTMRFDIVIVDIMMPEVDGYTFLETLSADVTLMDIPRIAISTRRDAETQARALACGAHKFLAKPLDWNALPNLLHDMVKS